MDASTLSGRIQIAMLSAGIPTPSDLARRMKVGRQTVHRWLSGASDKITPQLLFTLSDALNVNAKWLALGEPPMWKPTALQIDEKELVDLYRALDPSVRDDWVSRGRELVIRTTPKSPINPFPTKRNSR